MERARALNYQKSSMGGFQPACVSTEEAAAIFGWPNYYLPFLVRSGHLKPLGKPAQNARKWFATVEIERMSSDPVWLDKAIRIVEKQIQEMNNKQRGKEHLNTVLVCAESAATSKNLGNKS